MAASQTRRNRETTLKVNRHCKPDREINILLLGSTGVGKSTFINAFANYIVNDTLEQAVNDEMQAIIASSFSYTDKTNFEEKLIVIGKDDEYEQYKNVGQSNTLQCRSFIFPIGDRNLRFIDTPGIGDTKGLHQDEKNFQEILNYIAQFEHLNAVFIMFKPNEDRMSILFRYSVYELFRHLDVGAKDNIVFVFTNVRSTFYTPGSTSTLLRKLLDTHREKYNVSIPFSKENTFLFDNEAFRYLALRKNGIRVDNEQAKGFTASWNHSINEYTRLMQHINQCPLHATGNVLSLNEAEQLVRKLPRPIAETARLIEVNIQLAKDHKRRAGGNRQLAPQRIPQKNVEVAKLTYPRTVCTNDKCCRVTGEGIDKKVEYLSICHDRCFLNGVEQEKIADPTLIECEIMDPDEGFCMNCRCPWKKHKHITYECNTRHTYAKSNTTNEELSLDDINQYIKDLQEEQAQIQDIYKKLAQFLHVSSMLPINDGYIEYLRYFIHEEKMKRNSGDYNTEVIDNLEKMMADYESEIELFKRTLEDQKRANEEIKTLKPDDVFALSGTLYHLPINGKQIRAQVDGVKFGQVKHTSEREKFIELPAKAAQSSVMVQLTNIVTTKPRQ